MMGFLQRGFAYGNRRGFAIPLPELKIEEQIQYNSLVGLDGGTGGTKWAGQRFWTSPNRKIATLAFLLRKYGTATGNVTFAIIELPTLIVLNSKIWGDASDVPTTYPPTEWCEVEFDTPILIKTHVRMIVEFSGGDGENQIAMLLQTGGSVKPDEEFVQDVAGSDPTKDAVYRYKYYE